jgi:hypothetical protein
MKNVDYDKLTKQTHATKEQLDIILDPFKGDIENGSYTVIYNCKEAIRDDIDYLCLDEYIAELEKTLEEKQNGNPCFMCHNARCEYCFPVKTCFENQEEADELFNIDNDRLERIVEDTYY